MKKKMSPPRDSEQTRRKILTALGSLLATSGFRDGNGHQKTSKFEHLPEAAHAGG